jgi:serine/threonine protein kinase/Tol biopolymer transport system component
MTTDRWRHVKRLFHEALTHAPEARDAFLTRACSGDSALRASVAQLLESHEAAAAFMEGSPVAGVASALAERGRLTGTALGPYRVGKLLGAGGMGEVYEGADARIGACVAIKVVPGADPEAQASLRREARHAAALSHPHICKTFEVGESEAGAYVAMELVDGERLGDCIPPDGWDAGTVIELALQIAQAAAHAHGRGIKHGDLKSANVMLTKDQQIKVLDFGLARRLPGSVEHAVSAPSFTDAGAIAGTLTYLAPEVLRGVRGDARTDVWAFGILLHEMLTGHQPFAGRTPFELTSAILNDQPPDLPATIPTGLRIVRDNCLAKNPAQRYDDARDLVTALEAVRAGGRIARHTRSRTRRAVLSGAALTAAISVVLLLAGFALERWTHPRAPSPSPWIQLTHFPDSATSPMLSADGRLVVFIRGQSTFVGRGQVYVKRLPEGDPVPLTSDSEEKMSPVFSPEGSRAAYTVVRQSGGWETWVVPVSGGQPQRLLPNASGLTWTDHARVMFSELVGGEHMALIAANERREDARQVYVPPSDVGMAHRSYLSPDRKWVLLSEMTRFGWLPCRLVPFDGRSRGRPVGPGAACTSAAWSPDSKWMYFAADAGTGFHIWRQPFPEGKPEQLTSGPTEQEGVALAPDGRSFVTSVGGKESAVWIHDARGQRQISSEGYADLPGLGSGAASSVFSADGRRVFYLVRRGPMSTFGAGDLWVADLDSGRNERLMPGVLMTAFDISADGDKVVYCSTDAQGKSHVWIASFQRPSSARRLSPTELDRVSLGPDGSIIFQRSEAGHQYIFHIKEDGTQQERLLPFPDLLLKAVSPDRQWMIVEAPAPGEDRPSGVFAYPIHGGTPVRICGFCDAGWSQDERFFFVRIRAEGAGEGGKVFGIALARGRILPPFPPGGINRGDDLSGMAVAQELDTEGIPHISFGRDPSVYAFSRVNAHRDLYRIPVP